jgi:glyoxylase-like metal-dependent hydrolase (beta-lactamase superfamily II)
VLVDTGVGVRDRLEPSRAVKWFCTLGRIPFDESEAAVRQIQRLGLDPGNVKHILMTHLHFDHAGGLPDFPDATVHVHRPEHEAAMNASGLSRFLYRAEHWLHGPNWEIHDLEGAMDWYGHESIPVSAINQFEVRLIPLVGHSAGHCGVAIRGEKVWVLHCGDALPFGGVEANPPEWITRRLIGPHVSDLRRLAGQYPDEIRLISSHMPLQDGVASHWSS